MKLVNPLGRTAEARVPDAGVTGPGTGCGCYCTPGGPAYKDVYVVAYIRP